MARYSPFASPNICSTSVVTIGELYSFAIRRAWGNPRREKLRDLLAKVPRVDIHNESILQLYAEIDAFSQGKHPTAPLIGSARKMGKNDLWIAATATVMKATLLTTDRDFDHLNGVFLPVIFVDPAAKP